MSQTTSSALNNRIVKFVDFDNEDFDCVICYQIADEPVRCNSMCSGIYCNVASYMAKSSASPSAVRAAPVHERLAVHRLEPIEALLTVACASI